MVISLFSRAVRWISLARILWNFPICAVSFGNGASIQMSLIRGDIGSDSMVSELKLDDCVWRLLVRGNGTGTCFREINMLDRNESRESNDVVCVGGSLTWSATVSGVGVGLVSCCCLGVSTPGSGLESCVDIGIDVAFAVSVSPEGRHSF